MLHKLFRKLITRIRTAGINWKVAILFSAILPALNLINNSQQRIFDEWYRILGNWTLTFLFLLSSWILNALMYSNVDLFREKIKVKRIITVLFVNISFLTMFMLFVILILNDFDISKTTDRNYYLLFFRGLISVLVIYLIQFTLYSSRQAQEVVTQNEMLKTENLRARFEVLRQQVNPHFLFNSLSTLRSMIYSGDKNAEQFVIRLSEMYRQLLQKQQQELISLSEELAFLDDYSYMLFSRFEKMLFVEKDIDELVLTKKLPTFCLQILVENCVKHNIISQNKPLHIKIYNSGLNYLIVENNLQPKLSRQEPSGFGLNNLIKRYELANVDNGLTLFSDESVFRVKIKLLQP